MAEAINANQQPRLNLGHPLQKPFGITRDCNPRRNEERRIDGDHDRVDRIRFQGDQNVLQRRKHDEGPKQRAMVATPRGRHGDELAQGPKRNQSKQHRRRHGAKPQPRDENDAHHPPRPNSQVQRANHRRIGSALRLPAEGPAHKVCHGQNPHHRSEQDIGDRIEPDVRQGGLSDDRSRQQ